MRKAIPLVVVVAVSLASTACGGAATDDSAGQSGRPPAPEVTSTTTTEVIEVDASIPEETIEIPDVSDIEITYDGEVVADEVSGDVVLNEINRLLVADAPPLLQPEGTFFDLEGSELDDAVDEATELAPRRAVALFLGLDPADTTIEMLIADHGDRVIVVQTLEDDSVRAIRYEFNLTVDSPDIFVPVEATTTTLAPAEGSTDTEATTTTTIPEGELVNSIPYFLNGTFTQQCQPGRGHQDFTPAACV